MTAQDPVPATAVQKDDLVQYWRTSQNCGINCLYLLLNSHGHNVDYAAVQEATQVGQFGSSMQQMVDAAGKLGVTARVGRGGVKELSQLELPVILHLDSTSGSIEETGHYELLTNIDAVNGIATLFDGTSALFTQLEMRSLRNTWSGHVLELDRPWTDRLPFASIGAGVLALCCLGLWTKIRKRSPAREQPA